MVADQLTLTFSALADPTRRAILARLADGEATVNELAEPFAMPQYRPAARVAAERLEAQSALYAARVLEYIQRASNYVLGVVLFASALFFAGISTKLTTPRLRVAMLALGCLVFVGTAIWIATSPISIAV